MITVEQSTDGTILLVDIYYYLLNISRQNPYCTVRWAEYLSAESILHNAHAVRWAEFRPLCIYVINKMLLDQRTEVGTGAICSRYRGVLR